MRYLVLLILLAACGDAFAPSDAVRFQPDPEWEWRYYVTSVEMCSGITGNYDRISWFRVPRPAVDHRGNAGMWAPPHSIYLADPVFSYEEGQRGWLARHEVLHDVLGGDPAHRSPAWKRCGLHPSQVF